MSQFTVAEVEAGALRRDGTSTIQEVTVIDNTLHVESLKGMNELRHSSHLCDVSLCVDDRTFPSHRVVLAAFSPYFKAMFLSRLCESEQHQVVISGVEAAILELLIDFAYTASITINTSNVQSLLSGAHMLQVGGVVTACTRFLEHQLDPSNVLGILQLADTLACDDLRAAATRYVNSQFERVMRESELLEQSVSSLVAVLSSEAVQVTREEDVFAAVMRWLHHDTAGRAQHLHKVLKWVRLCQVSPYFLVDVVEAEPAVRSSPECRLLVEEARLYHLLPDRRHQYHSKTSLPRPLPNRVITMGMVSVCSQDAVGCYEDLQWYNPATADWQLLTELPQPLSGVSACVPGAGSSLYVAGGSVSQRWGSPLVCLFYKYDAILQRWLELQTMKVARYQPALVAQTGNIYCLGGSGQSSSNNTVTAAVEVYNVQHNLWCSVAPLPLAVQHPAVATLGGAIYVCGGVGEGGDQDGGTTLDEVQVYNPHKDSWSTCARLLYPRSAATAAVLNGRLYVTGGCLGFLTVTNKTERYDPKRDAWQELAHMATARKHHDELKMHE